MRAVVRHAKYKELSQVSTLLAEVFQREYCIGPFGWLQMAAIRREILIVSACHQVQQNEICYYGFYLANYFSTIIASNIPPAAIARCGSTTIYLNTSPLQQSDVWKER